MEAWSIAKLLAWATGYFKNLNSEWPHLEAEILLAHALNSKRIDLYTRHESILTDTQLATFKALIQRRAKHEPIAYITGQQPFMSLDFMVDRSVLIPRPETEKLVEVAIDFIKTKPATDKYLVVDIGTGSGAIAVTLAKYLSNIEVIGIDCSVDALQIASTNAEKHQVSERCQFVAGNLLEPLSVKANLIVANPPYIPTAEIEGLQSEVKDWEPRQALDGGADGLIFIRQLIEQSADHLKADAALIFEFGFNQAERIKNLAQTHFRDIKIIKDHAGMDRILKAEL